MAGFDRRHRVTDRRHRVIEPVEITPGPT